MVNTLMVTYWQYPSIGAIDVYLRHLRDRLRKAGHQVDIICRGAAWGKLRCYENSIEHITEGVKSNAQDLDLFELAPLATTLLRGSAVQNPQTPKWIIDREVEQYLFELGLSRLRNLKQYDIIHAHDVHSSRAVARVAPGMPLVLTTHGLLAYEWLTEKQISGGDSQEWQYTYLREQLGVTSANVAITPCDWMRQEYIDYFKVPAERIVSLLYGFDTEEFSAEKTQAPANIPNLAGSVVITMVARLVPLKGHRYLLQALREVAKTGIKIRCLLVGTGEEEQKLRKLVKSLGIEQMVHFLGKRDDVPDILRMTDIFVLPSIQEITPLAVSEAQLSGKAVIASNVGGIPDLVEDGKTGILTPPEDPKALAKALITLCKDKDLRNRLGTAGKAAVLRDRTWDRHFQRLLECYDLAINRCTR